MDWVTILPTHYDPYMIKEAQTSPQKSANMRKGAQRSKLKSANLIRGA